MRLVIFGEDPRITRGGIPRYLLPLASALAHKGYEIHYLFSGAYTGRYDWTFRRRWRTSTRDNVTIHELLNPSSIGIHGADPDLDVTNSDIRCIRRRVGQLAPDLIHIHSLVGIPLGVLSQISPLAPIILSIHDYSLLCQRRVLVQRDQSRCRTFASQVDCAWCVNRTNPRRYKARARLHATPGGIGLKMIHAVERATRSDLAIDGASPEPSSASQVQAEPFRRRLAESVRLVNENVSSVLAVSCGVRDILLRVGVDSQRVSVMHIGSASAERLDRLPLPCQSGESVTFMYLGGLVPGKGAHVLVKALKLMPTPHRVVIAGGGENSSYIRDLHSEAPKSVRFYPAFTSDELPHLLAQADVVIAPAVAPDTGPQIVLEALAAGRPVVGSDVGGIPDFVQDGVNGRIFPCEDASALAAILSELAIPDRVLSLARNARLRTTVNQHVDQLITLYESHVGGHNGSKRDDARVQPLLYP